jgi:hypothetical protein
LDCAASIGGAAYFVGWQKTRARFYELRAKGRKRMASAELSPMETQVVEFVRQRDHVSFTELTRMLADRIPIKGKMAITLDTDPNFLFWAGVSAEFADLMIGLFARRMIVPVPCAPLVYLVDGAMLDFPLAKSLPSGGYATEHWCPVVLRPAERIAPPKPQRAPRGKR